VINGKDTFFGEGYRKVWARLQIKGTVIDKERVRKLMRANNLSAPTRPGNPRGSKAHDGTIIPMKANTIWGTDATSVWTIEDGKVTVFAAIDHFVGDCIGLHAAKVGNRFEALEPLRQAIPNYVGPYEKDVAQDILLRHDHGSQYMSDDFQKEIKFLGMTSSPSFVREPEGNGVIERFFKTLKEQLLWIETFRNVEELLAALHDFKERFNKQWIMQRHGYKTPDQVRAVA
jgi:transposase InsO family protein